MTKNIKVDYEVWKEIKRLSLENNKPAYEVVKELLDTVKEEPTSEISGDISIVWNNKGDKVNEITISNIDKSLEIRKDKCYRIDIVELDETNKDNQEQLKFKGLDLGFISFGITTEV